ncbi:hypothetical protein PsYK624_015430 [Phanerochaete sordida]|uniref:Uncharacterized protein n=1 Tax=Phanerochaete sordida TaxID=48140 RepID=A0A9P3L8F7_9APHY|nr:hypothetical protein PsYK624_015430 [Phanerochaete sordida]
MRVVIRGRITRSIPNPWTSFPGEYAHATDIDFVHSMRRRAAMAAPLKLKSKTVITVSTPAMHASTWAEKCSALQQYPQPFDKNCSAAKASDVQTAPAGDFRQRPSVPAGAGSACVQVTSKRSVTCVMYAEAWTQRQAGADARPSATHDRRGSLALNSRRSTLCIAIQ